MRILVYGSNYAPELTGIGKYTGELARWLAARGHQVKVVTAPPHYPEWRVQSGYAAWRWSRKVEEQVTVWRCPTWIPSRPRGLTRLLHAASFVVGSLPILLGQLAWRPDIVWVVEPPLMCSPIAALVARLGGARLWLHVQDFEVDAAFQLGLLKGQRAAAIALGFESWIMRRCDIVSTISEKMMGRLKIKGVQESKIESLPNWVDLGMFDDVTPARISALRRKLEVPAGAIVALYSGNMGRKQGLEILAEVAGCTRSGSQSHEALWFVICGNGVMRQELERLCRGHANVRFLDLLPAEEFPVLLKLADIHLLPQLPEASDLVMPSKLTAILASGRPVVATASSGTELERVASNGGLVVAPADHQAMASAILTLASDGEMRTRLGQAGRAYAESKLNARNVLTAVEARFFRLVEKNRG